MSEDTSWMIAKHVYDPGPSGRCQSGWVNVTGQWVPCKSSQASSVLHYDEESDFREMHDHGGGDCMCFEGKEW